MQSHIIFPLVTHMWKIDLNYLQHEYQTDLLKIYKNFQLFNFGNDSFSSLYCSVWWMLMFTED